MNTKKIFGLFFLISATFSLASCGKTPEPEPENYYTITWKNDDGSTLSTTKVEEGKMPVYDKDTPKKEPTTTETFTFSGWTPDVVIATKDTTYTATYTSSTRKYTISWYNDEEETKLLHTEYLEYDATPSYHWTDVVPSKPETDRKRYDWNGWEESIVSVKGDAKYHAKFDEVNKYLIIFINYDCTILQESYVASTEIPEYKGEQPFRPDDEQYKYEPEGWDRDLVKPNSDAVYMYTYIPRPKNS